MSISANEARRAWACALAALAAGCSLAPRYARPSVEAPAAYKEAPDYLKPAEPRDAQARGPWWTLFGDEQLDGFEARLGGSNQNVAAAAAAFLAARAVVAQARSQYFPTLTATPSAIRSYVGATPFGFKANTSFTEYSLPVDASWQPDFWGKTRNAVAAGAFAAQASAADLENVRLTAQAELAVDYYELRAQDELIVLLSSAAQADGELLALASALAKGGLSSEQAVAQVRAQLEAARAQAVNAGLLRAQYEHAIAVLLAQPPSDFSISTGPFRDPEVAFPVGVPSALLERRPDVAAAERSVAQANAQIGVARAACFPNVTLSAQGGFQSFAASSWLDWASRFWSLGASAGETLFDAGSRKAVARQYTALREQAAANYRQTALAAFEQVEDDLAAMRISSASVSRQDAAAQSALRSLNSEWARYQGGVDPYQSVLSAQVFAIAQQQSALAFRLQHVTSAVQLIEALGGGWDASRLPKPEDLR